MRTVCVCAPMQGYLKVKISFTILNDIFFSPKMNPLWPLLLY